MRQVSRVIVLVLSGDVSLAILEVRSFFVGYFVGVGARLVVVGMVSLVTAVISSGFARVTTGAFR